MMVLCLNLVLALPGAPPCAASHAQACASVRKHEYFSRQVRQEYPLSLITVAERLLVAGSRKVTHGCLRSLMVTKNNL